MLNLLAKVNKMDPIPGGLYTFVLGLLVIFLGITIIVIFVSIAGKIFSTGNEKVKEPKVKAEPKKVEVKKEQPVIVESNEVPEHIKVAIIAAISAYYEEKKSNCDFIVKKIRRF